MKLLSMYIYRYTSHYLGHFVVASHRPEKRDVKNKGSKNKYRENRMSDNLKATYLPVLQHTCTYIPTTP